MVLSPAKLPCEAAPDCPENIPGIYKGVAVTTEPYVIPKYREMNQKCGRKKCASKGLHILCPLNSDYVKNAKKC